MWTSPLSFGRSAPLLEKCRVSIKASFIDLARLFPGAVAFDVPLSKISRWKVGGQADLIVSPRNTEELSRLRRWLYERQLPSVTIGATSNLLFADEGLRAIAIQITSNFAPITISETNIIAGPGFWVPLLARKAHKAQLAGIEHTCGIPGTLGGLVCMNGGSQRKGIGEVVTFVRSVDDRGLVVGRTQQECGFAYRTSIFQKNNEIVAEIHLRLGRTIDLVEQRRLMLSILRERRRKFPQKAPNCGSVFVSNPAMYADYGPPGKIIEQAGFKGFQIGGAQVTVQHANFINNTGGAKASDILKLINLIRDKVESITGYRMVVEARFVSEDGICSEI